MPRFLPRPAGHVLSLAAALLLAACGGGDNAGTATASAPNRLAAAATAVSVPLTPMMAAATGEQRIAVLMVS
ncbi:MAG TPA: hypothetical protein VIT92_07705, partial [Burkholderiaceae bacterium]